MTVGRSTQSVVEVLLAPTPVAIVTQAVVEVLVTVADAPPEPDSAQPVIFVILS